jgi:hypothetical protein
VIGIFRLLESQGVVSIGRTRIVARAAGAKFSNDDASRWLAPLVAAADRKPGVVGRSASLKRGPKRDAERGPKIEHVPDRNAEHAADRNGQQNDGADLLDQLLADGRVQRGFGPKNEHDPDRSDGASRAVADGPKRADTRGPKNEHDSDRNGDSAPDRISRARTAKDLVKIASDTPLRSVSESDLHPGAHEAETADERDPAVWVPKLREDVNAIRDKRIRELSVQERLLVARYHAYRFANCTKSLSRNRKAGADIVVGIAKLASSELYADLTVSQYVAAALRYHTEIADGAPWRNPFMIRALEEGLEPRRAAR